MFICFNRLEDRPWPTLFCFVVICPNYRLVCLQRLFLCFVKFTCTRCIFLLFPFFPYLYIPTVNEFHNISFFFFSIFDENNFNQLIVINILPCQELSQHFNRLDKITNVGKNSQLHKRGIKHAWKEIMCLQRI